jgi:hypothetical protein
MQFLIGIFEGDQKKILNPIIILMGIKPQCVIGYCCKVIVTLFSVVVLGNVEIMANDYYLTSIVEF